LPRLPRLPRLPCFSNLFTCLAAILNVTFD
jgi:hypothetical protein